jgi:predicted nucleic acid-binding protein
MNAIDTNVWIYSHDSRDESKRRTAQKLIATLEPIALLWQVGCEFVAAARKLEPFGFSPQQAWAALADMQAMADAVLLPNCETWSIARDVHERLQLHFWDALIVAACIQGRVDTLYSEDFGDRIAIEGLRIVNPFVGT